MIALVIDRRLVPFGRNGLAAPLGRGGDVLLEGDEVAQRRRIRERGQETDLLRTIEDRFTLGALRGLAERDRVLERLTSPGHGRRPPFQQLERRGRDHGGGQACGLRLVLIGQQPRAGHVEIDDAVAVQGTRPDEASDRRLYQKADQLHDLLQLSA